jgi:hypothetical protein
MRIPDVIECYNNLRHLRLPLESARP